MVASIGARDESRGDCALLGRLRRLNLAAGRALLLDWVRAFDVVPEWEGPFTRLVSAIQSREGLIAALDLLKAHLQGRMPGTGALGWLAARLIDHQDEGHVILGVTEILYVFMGYATSKNLVMARWTVRRNLDRQRVYVRATDGLYIPDLRSLSAVRAHLGSAIFVPLHQSILLRRGAGRHVIRDGRLDMVGIRLPDGSKEWLAVSRRCQWPLNREIGRRQRTPRGRSDPGRGNAAPATGSRSSAPNPAPTLVPHMLSR